MYCGYESTCYEPALRDRTPEQFVAFLLGNFWFKCMAETNTKLSAQAQRAKWDSQPIVRNGSIGHCINKNTHSPIPEIKMKINNVNLISAWSNTSTPVCSFAGIHFSQGPEFQNLHKHKLDKKKKSLWNGWQILQHFLGHLIISGKGREKLGSSSWRSFKTYIDPNHPHL